MSGRMISQLSVAANTEPWLLVQLRPVDWHSYYVNYGCHGEGMVPLDHTSSACRREKIP